LSCAVTAVRHNETSYDCEKSCLDDKDGEVIAALAVMFALAAVAIIVLVVLLCLGCCVNCALCAARGAASSAQPGQSVVAAPLSRNVSP
jgi:hypothetical protein